jgi:hypothetical protein
MMHGRKDDLQILTPFCTLGYYCPKHFKNGGYTNETRVRHNLGVIF